MADVQAKTQSASTALKNSVTQLGNTFGKLNDDAIRLIKGVSDKALKAVSDLYASTLGELLKVTDSAIQAEVDGFTSALQSGQDALKSFVSQLSSLRRNILTQSQIDLENTLNDFKKNFNTFIDAQKSFVSDANLVVKKVVGCEATAVNSFNKNVMASVVKDGGACVAAFLKADAAVNAQLGGLFSNISANAVAALKSVTKCVSDNKLTNAASIDAASQTVKDSLTACLDGVSMSCLVLKLP